MAVDSTDVSEVVTLKVSHPSEAPILVGKEFVTPWFQMDKDRADDFHRGAYLDSYPHPYGGQSDDDDDVIEGFHLLGMLDYLCNHGVYSEGPWIAWNYGLDHARFVSVVRFDDPFRIRGTVRDVVDRGEQGYLLVSDLIGEVRGRDKPGFVATMRVLWAAAS